MSLEPESRFWFLDSFWEVPSNGRPRNLHLNRTLRWCWAHGKCCFVCVVHLQVCGCDRVHIGVHVVPLQIRAHVCRARKSTLGVFIFLSSFYILRQGFSLRPDFTKYLLWLDRFSFTWCFFIFFLIAIKVSSKTVFSKHLEMKVCP